MAINLQSKTNVAAADSEYPYGNIKDNTGLNDGTPVNKEVYADIHQFFARMFALSGLVYNGEPENAYDGFQYNEAFDIVSRPFLTTRVITSTENLGTTFYTVSNYTKYKTAFQAGNVGAITVTLPAIANILDGAVFPLSHQGSGVVTVASDAADSINGAASIDLTASGDYCLLIADKTLGQWNIYSYSNNVTTYASPATATNQNSWTGAIQYQRSKDGFVTLNGTPTNTWALALIGAVVTNLPAGFRPTANKQFPHRFYGVTAAAFYDVLITIQTNGDVIFTPYNPTLTIGETINLYLDGIEFNIGW